MPTTVAPAGTSFVTTELAPILAPSPTSIGPEHLRARADDDVVANGRVTLSANARRRVGAAQRHILVDGHVVADLRSLADHREAVVDEEVAADLRARVDVDRGQEARDMVHEAREEVELAFPQPVADAVKPSAMTPG